MADLRLVRPEEVGEVPVTRMPAFIIHGKAENSGDRKEAETEGALPADILSDPSSSVAAAAAEDLSKSENSSSASESGGGSSNSSSDDDDSDGSDKASLPVGTKVVLTDDYKDFGDAAGGPLKPGDVGEIIESDGSSNKYKVKAADGRTWWYRGGAVEKEKKEQDSRNKMQLKTQANGRDIPAFPVEESTMNAKIHQLRAAGEQLRRAKEEMQQLASIKLRREDSTPFYERKRFDSIVTFEDLVARRDLEGNSITHHLAAGQLSQSMGVVNIDNSRLRWIENDLLETPQMILDGILEPLTPMQRVLHRALHDGQLLHDGSTLVHPCLVRSALKRCSPTGDPAVTADSTAEGLFQHVKHALAQGKNAEVLSLSSRLSHPKRHLFSSLAMMADRNMRFSAKQAQMGAHNYLREVLHFLDEDAMVDPMLYYVRFRLYQQSGRQTMLDRQREAAALRALCCFPDIAEYWLKDDIAVIPHLMRMQEKVDDNDLDGSTLEDVLPRDDETNEVENEWKMAKLNHQLSSGALDELMKLTGLVEIKQQAMGIVKEVLLQQDRPASVNAAISMNFLFTGNPGCGKTTVATLLARAMSELGFRSSPSLVETSAQEILKLKDPGAEFKDMMEKAMGGTIIIDEAYRFSPARQGESPNSSNHVLDYLLETVEKPETRNTTTVIMAGYRDEIEQLLAYNVGFASRFPLEFAFPDYDEEQLRKIFLTMVASRGMRLANDSDVDIARIVARRVHQGAGKKGFGNARSVRNKVEQIIKAHGHRLGNMKMRNERITEQDFKVLSLVDCIGTEPIFERCKPMQELMAMAGLVKIKRAMQNLVSMVQLNYKREMNGDQPDRISLHRVFYGNPGTGKTTVAALYGRLLKDLGLLSRGDFISVTPADLTGDAEGAAAANTREVLERAKGKVLLIDEAYVLDPRRKNNQYGGNVLDTLVEKLDGEAGSDIAVILAGYKQEMFDMLENNPGLRRRFNIDDFPFHFEDMSDEELKQVLVSTAGRAGMVFDSVELVDDVVAVIAQKRRMAGFGNAGTVCSMVNLAKQSKAARLAEAQQVHDQAVRENRKEIPALPDPNVLIRADFIHKESDPQAAKKAFADSLYNIDHIMEELDRMEALILAAKEEGREPADILSDSHMVFVGPPGTGKTTVAKRFGQLFKDLDILPSGNVTVVTGTGLMGQYVGETKEKVLKYMHQARGGILLIDEAYGLLGGTFDGRNGTGSYGREAVDTLVGLATSDEFKGNLLVIMAGYEESMDALFAHANPGFASRFNKRRLSFLPWSAEQAANVVISEIERQNKSLTDGTRSKIHEFCCQLERLPSWGSARDVFETFLPSLFEARACRVRELKLSSRTEPYQPEDVNAALEPVVVARRKIKSQQSTKMTSWHSGRDKSASEPAAAGRGTSWKGADDREDSSPSKGKAKHKQNIKTKTRRIDDHDGGEEDMAGIDITGALEQACQDLGYSAVKIAEILGEGGTYPRELLDRIATLTGCTDTALLPGLLDKQKGNLLARIKQVIERSRREKSEEEARCQETLRQLGQCPLGFDWLQEDGGWRCAGGSHFVSDNELAQFRA